MADLLSVVGGDARPLCSLLPVFYFLLFYLLLLKSFLLFTLKSSFSLFNQALFVMQSSLVCNAIKSCLSFNQALFATHQIPPLFVFRLYCCPVKLLATGSAKPDLYTKTIASREAVQLWCGTQGTVPRRGLMPLAVSRMCKSPLCGTLFSHAAIPTAAPQAACNGFRIEVYLRHTPAH